MLDEVRVDAVWGCKIGSLGNTNLPPGADAPMREAVSRAYEELTGTSRQFIFSGWGEALTPIERAIAENSPIPEPTDPLMESERYRMQMAGISTAAMGYWKEGESIHPDYDTVALHDVAKLYAKYAHLAESKAQTVDVAAIREVIVQLRHSSIWDTTGALGWCNGLAKTLDAALPKE